jgi:anti-sigma regulatory factor (Ser/Thr protein kinase)
MTYSITDPAPPPISMRIRGGPGAPGTARRSVLARLDDQTARGRASDAALIVSELVTNSVLHADVGSDQTLTVELARLANRLRITVADPGSELEPHLREPDPGSAGGFGLLLVDELAVAWGTARDDLGATRVWCELQLEQPSPAHR